MTAVDQAQVQRTVRRPSRLFRNLTSKTASLPMILTVLVIFVGCTLWTVVYSFTKSKLLPVELFTYAPLFSIPVPVWLADDGALNFSIISGPSSPPEKTRWSG